MWRREINELYLMECQGYVKIGIAQCSQARRRLLQTGNPFKITLLQVLKCNDPQAEESAFHKKYAQYRTRGEWFLLPKEVLWQLMFETNEQVRTEPPLKWDGFHDHSDQEPDPEYWSRL